MPTADTSRCAIPAGSFSHWASTSYLNSSACGGVLSPRTVAPSGWLASWRCRRARAQFLGSASGRGAEPGQGGAVAGVVEHDLDRQADGDGAWSFTKWVRPDDVGHHPRPLVELDVGEHVRSRAGVGALAAVVERV